MHPDLPRASELSVPNRACPAWNCHIASWSHQDDVLIEAFTNVDDHIVYYHHELLSVCVSLWLPKWSSCIVNWLRLDDVLSNPAFSRGKQLVSFRFEYRLPVPEHRNYEQQTYIIVSVNLVSIASENKLIWNIHLWINAMMPNDTFIYGIQWTCHHWIR